MRMSKLNLNNVHDNHNNCRFEKCTIKKHDNTLLYFIQPNWVHRPCDIKKLFHYNYGNLKRYSFSDSSDIITKFRQKDAILTCKKIKNENKMDG